MVWGVWFAHRFEEDDVLDCSGQDVAIVKETNGEGQAVIEDVLGLV